MYNSNKGTGGMESSVVLFKPRIHLFACTHLSVSNTLDYNDWLAYKHQSAAFCSNTFGVWFRVVYKHQSPPCVSNMPRLWILVVHTHKYPALCSNMFGLWFRVGVQASVYSPLIKQFGLWFLVVSSIVSNTCGLWILVCVHASSPSLCFKRLDDGSVSVYKHLSPAPFDQTRLDWSSMLCTSISLHPCFKHILCFLVRAHHQSTALCLKHV